MAQEEKLSVHSVHTMPVEALRARAGEAERLIAQAREIARDSFDGAESPSTRLRAAAHAAGATSPEASEAPRRVGLLLDAAQRLLPGMPPLTEERVRSTRTKDREANWRRVTLRAGAEKAIEAIERAELLASVQEHAARLIAEIAQRASSSSGGGLPFRAETPSVFPASDPTHDPRARNRS